MITVMLQFSPGQCASVCVNAARRGWKQWKSGQGGPTGALLSALMCIRALLATARSLPLGHVVLKRSSDASEAPLRGLNLLPVLYLPADVFTYLATKVELKRFACKVAVPVFNGSVNVQISDYYMDKYV